MKKRAYLSLVLVLVVSLFYSCGERKAHKTGITFSSGAMVSSSNGGLILVGKRDTGEYFSTNIETFSGSSNTTETTIEIQGGVWDFYAMSWESNDNKAFTGLVRCGSRTGYKVTGNNDKLTISLSKANCDSDGISSSSYRNKANSDTIPKIKLVACNNLEDITNRSSSCSNLLSSLGPSFSFKVAMGGMKSATLNTSNLTELESECLSVSSNNNPIINTDLRIGVMPNGPFGVKIKTYADPNCSSAYHMATVEVPEGLGGSNTNASKGYAYEQGTEARNTIFFPDNYTGHGTSTLKNQAPSIQCQNQDGNWIHCFPGSTTQVSSNNGTNFHAAKSYISNVLGTADANHVFSGSSSRALGVLPEMARDMVGAIGANLHKNGITNCDDIKVGDSLDTILSNGWVARGVAQIPQKTVPTHFTGGASNPYFEKRIAFYLGTSETTLALNTIMEFNCTSGLEKVGWFRLKESQSDPFEVEMWYDTTDQTSAKVETYIYSQYASSGVNNKYREVMRFHKTGATSYTVWVSGLSFKETSGTSVTLDSDDNFYTCDTNAGCVSTCYDQSGSTATCSSDVLLSSSDSQSGTAPILYNTSESFTNFSIASLAAGNQEGWSILSPFTADGSSVTTTTSGVSGYYSGRARYTIKGKMGTGENLHFRVQLAGITNDSSTDTTGSDGTVYSGVNSAWDPVWFEKCGNGTISNCTESVAKSSCTAIGKKLISHASDGNLSDVERLYDGTTGSCQWSSGYFTTTNSDFNSGGKCLIAVSNVDWSTGNCCSTDNWHGRTILMGQTSGGIWGWIHNSNQGYVSGQGSSAGRQWSCRAGTTVPTGYSSCTNGEYYVGCK